MLNVDNKEIPLRLEIDVILTTLIHAFMSGLTDSNLKEGEFNKKWDPEYVKSLLDERVLMSIVTVCERQMADLFLEWWWAEHSNNKEHYLEGFNQDFANLNIQDILKRFDDGESWKQFIDNLFEEKIEQLQTTGNYRLKSCHGYEIFPAIDAKHGIAKAVSSVFIGYCAALMLEEKEIIDENSFAAILTWMLVDLLNVGCLPEKVLKEGRPANYQQFFLNLCGSQKELDVLEEVIAITYLNLFQKDVFRLKKVDNQFVGSASHYFADVVKRYKSKQVHGKK